MTLRHSFTKRAKECCKAGSAVEFVWKGDPRLPSKFGITSLYFLFRNKNYAIDFAHMNDLIVEEYRENIQQITPRDGQ